MKNIASRLLVLLVCLVMVPAASAQRALPVEPEHETPDYGLVVEVFPDRDSYVLGEIARLTVRMTNRSVTEMVLGEEPNVENGRLQILVAEDEGDFRRYIGPGWGLMDGIDPSQLVLAPGESFETTASLLYNFHPRTAHLSAPYAEAIRREHVDSDYLFETPGLYRLRAVLDLGGEFGTITSSPTRLEVLQPRGADLAVWNTLRQNSELGHLLQVGLPRGNPLSERSLVLAETLADLARIHPRSSVATEIRASLSRYRTTMERVQASATQ